MNIKPVNDNVLIRPIGSDYVEHEVPGVEKGILIKDQSKWNNFVQGQVIFIDPANSAKIAVGDKVYYARAITAPPRDEINVNGETLIVKKVADIVGVIKD
jgi:co-chaperonin GroES (HSP10)